MAAVAKFVPWADLGMRTIFFALPPLAVGLLSESDQFTLGTGNRLSRDCGKTGDFLEPFLRFIQDRQRPLGVFFGSLGHLRVAGTRPLVIEHRGISLCMIPMVTTVIAPTLDRQAFRSSGRVHRKKSSEDLPFPP